MYSPLVTNHSWLRKKAVAHKHPTDTSYPHNEVFTWSTANQDFLSDFDAHPCLRMLPPIDRLLRRVCHTHLTLEWLGQETNDNYNYEMALRWNLNGVCVCIYIDHTWWIKINRWVIYEVCFWILKKKKIAKFWSKKFVGTWMKQSCWVWQRTTWPPCLCIYSYSNTHMDSHCPAPSHSEPMELLVF